MHLHTSFDYIKRSPFQALAAISVLAMTFFVATMVCILTYGSGKFLSYLETRPQIIAFLKKEATTETANALLQKLQKDERVKDVKYVSKEEALEIYKKVTSDNPLLGELVSPSIFPASVEFSLTDISIAQNIIDEVKKEGVVENVGFTANLGGEAGLNQAIERLKSITFYTRTGGGVFVGLLGFVSLLVLMIIISMRITARKVEIRSLSLLGATRAFIRAPILYEALLYVLLGVFFGWLLAVILLLYTTPSVIAYFAEIPVLPASISEFAVLLALVLVCELVIGFLLAFVSGFIAVSRQLAD